ncbi:hypothetical protein GQX74_013112 [Glossina fuscipes]|nr:hypothetical protein GQX74_013112 [Glossina fuscipes]
MGEDDIYKTAVVTPFGMFDCRTQHIVFTFAYIVNVLVASKSESEHLTYLKLVFDRLSEYGLNVQPRKCVFGGTNLDFLGHKISREGILPFQYKNHSAIEDLENPKSIKQAQKFGGMINYYCRYKPNLAEYNGLIHNIINSCEHVEDAFASKVLLNHFNNEADLVIGGEKITIGQGPQFTNSDPAILRYYYKIPKVRWDLADHLTTDDWNLAEGLNNLYCLMDVQEFVLEVLRFGTTNDVKIAGAAIIEF